MQLGEVFEQSAAAAPPPRRPTRRRFLLPLLALAAVAGALVVHGPGVTQPEAHELLVITNDTGIDLFGPQVRVITGKSRVFHVPIATHVHRLSRQARTPDPISFTAHSADGVPGRYTRATVTYRLDGAGVEAVFRRLGSDPEAWDHFVRSALAAAWTEVITRHPAVSVGDPFARLAEVEAVLRTALSGLFTFTELRPPQASPTPEVQAALEGLRAAEAARAEYERAQADQRTQAQAATRAREEARATRLAGARSEATRILDAARAQARARIAEVRDHADALGVDAQARREALLRQAEVTRIRLPFEVEALKARVDALRTEGPALLDHLIATRIMPQLKHQGRPAAPATGAP